MLCGSQLGRCNMVPNMHPMKSDMGWVNKAHHHLEISQPHCFNLRLNQSDSPSNLLHLGTSDAMPKFWDDTALNAIPMLVPKIPRRALWSETQMIQAQINPLHPLTMLYWASTVKGRAKGGVSIWLWVKQLSINSG